MSYTSLLKKYDKEVELAEEESTLNEEYCYLVSKTQLERLLSEILKKENGENQNSDHPRRG